MMRSVTKRKVKYSIKWLLDILDLGQPLLRFLSPLSGKKWVLKGSTESARRSGCDLDNLFFPSEYAKKTSKYDLKSIIETPRHIYEKRSGLWELKKSVGSPFLKWIIGLLIDHEDVHYDTIKTLIAIAMRKGSLNSP